MATYMQLRNRKRYYPIEHVPTKRQKVSKPGKSASAQRAPQHKLASSFFSLPRELRDVIYEYAWGHERAWYFRCQRICVALNRRQTRVPPGYGLPSWILACKLILAEAIATLHRTHTFETINERERMRLHVGPQPLRRKAYKNPLVMNNDISKVRLPNNYVVRDEQKSDVPWQFWSFLGEEERFVQLLERLDVRDIDLVLEADAFFVRADFGNRWLTSGVTNPLDVFRGRCKSMTLELDVSWFGYSLAVKSIDSAIVAVEACVQGVVGNNKDGSEQFETTGGKAGIRKDGLISAYFASMT